MIVSLNHLPTTFQEFSSMADLSSPEKTSALFLCALELYLINQEDGIKAIDLLRGPRPMNGYDKQFIRDRLRGKEYLPKAYFAGAAPQNRYTPNVPYVIDPLPDRQPQEPGYIKLFLSTAGADSPRPIKLRAKGGNWYLWEYSSLLSGIRIPAEDDPWA